MRLSVLQTVVFQLSLAAVASLGASTEAWAQSGTKGLYYIGNSPMGWASGSAASSSVATQLVSAGASSVDTTSSWPGALTAYRVVVVIGGTSAYSSSQITDMKNFVDRGGVLVLVSDAPTYGYNSNLNTVASGIGTPLRFSGTTLGGGCETSTSINTGQPAMSGVSSIGWGFGSAITGGTYLWRTGSSDVAPSAAE